MDWNCRSSRREYRRDCFIHFAAGIYDRPMKARRLYLLNLVLCYGEAAVKRHIVRIQEAMRKAEVRARREAGQ